MKEIIELNKRILSEALQAVPKDLGFIGIPREGLRPEELAALPSGIKANLDALERRLNSVIPDDFGYLIDVGHADPGLTIFYRDGAQTSVNCPIDWDENGSIFDKLGGIDWGAERSGALERCQEFDRMVEEAKHKPPGLPSTKELQKLFRDAMKEFVRTKRKDKSRVHVLMWREDEGEGGEEFKNMESFGRELPDIMTVQKLVITVVAGGKPLPAKQIDKLKREALKELRGMPISQAKALLKL